ncbi:hypothetical protein ACFVY0_42795 [Streptomyces sp. NPDC058286]
MTRKSQHNCQRAPLMSGFRGVPFVEVVQRFTESSARLGHGSLAACMAN